MHGLLCLKMMKTYAAKIPFLDKMGVLIHELDDGNVEVHLPITEELINTWGTLQGGISMTLMDVAMGVSVKAIEPDCISSATIDMQTQFLLPAGAAGDKVIAKGKVYHRTRKLFFCESELWNDTRLVAKSTGVFKIIKSVTPN